MPLTDEYQKQVLKAFNEASHWEIYGLIFSSRADQWTKAHQNVLLKFLTANEGSIPAAKDQLLKTLKWRKEFKPLKATQEEFSSDLNKLAVITRSPEGKVVTWNLYGAISDPGSVFADIDNFIRWRVGLHERALSLLDFGSEELSYMDQVHDYLNVSFLRMDPRIRKSSSKVVEVFQTYYPETLSGKYFVNVPYIMMWVYRLVRGFTAAATTAKFHVLANGTELYSELGDWVSQPYGGKAKSLQEISVDTEASELAKERLQAYEAAKSQELEEAKAAEATSLSEQAAPVADEPVEERPTSHVEPTPTEAAATTNGTATLSAPAAAAVPAPTTGESSSGATALNTSGGASGAPHALPVETVHDPAPVLNSVDVPDARPLEASVQPASASQA